MRTILLILIVGLAGIACKSKSERGSVGKSIQNPKFIQRAWYLYDAESNSLMGKGPLFEMAAQQRFIDSAEILCHFCKLKTGDLLDLIRRHSDSNPNGEKLKNCPDYSYQGDILGIRVYDSPERNEAAVVTIKFADMKKRTRLQNGQYGQLYYLYVEMQGASRIMGSMLFSPDKAQINRVPVILIRSP